jgi:hypothetical protein
MSWWWLLVRVLSGLSGEAGGVGWGESVLETFGGVCSSVLRVLEPSLFFWGASRAVSASFILILWWRLSVCDSDDLADCLGVVLEVWGEIWFGTGHGGVVGELGGGGGGGLPGSVLGGGASGKR